MPDSGTPAGEAARDPEQPATEVNVEKLAERVYQLLIREVRLDLARNGHVMNRRGA